MSSFLFTVIVFLLIVGVVVGSLWLAERCHTNKEILQQFRSLKEDRPYIGVSTYYTCNTVGSDNPRRSRVNKLAAKFCNKKGFVYLGAFININCNTPTEIDALRTEWIDFVIEQLEKELS